MKLSIPIRLALDCPKTEGKIYLEDCRRCKFFKDVSRLHLFDPLVVCSFKDEDEVIKVRLMVNCPNRGGALVEFRKCLGCEHLDGFYGFHAFTPILHCRPDEDMRVRWGIE